MRTSNSASKKYRAPFGQLWKIARLGGRQIPMMATRRGMFPFDIHDLGASFKRYFDRAGAYR